MIVWSLLKAIYVAQSENNFIMVKWTPNIWFRSGKVHFACVRLWLCESHRLRKRKRYESKSHYMLNMCVCGHLCVFPPAILQFCSLICLVSLAHIWLMCSVALQWSEPHWADLQMTDINTHTRTQPECKGKNSPVSMGQLPEASAWWWTSLRVCVLISQREYVWEDKEEGRAKEGIPAFTPSLCVSVCV